MRKRNVIEKDYKKNESGKFSYSQRLMEVLLDLRDLLNKKDSKLYQIACDVKRLRLHNEKYFQIENKIEKVDEEVYKNYLKMTNQEEAFKEFIETYAEELN